MLPYLKGNMLACFRSMDAGRRHEIPESEMKENIIFTAVKDDFQ